MRYKTNLEYRLNSVIDETGLYNLLNSGKSEMTSFLASEKFDKYRFYKEYDCLQIINSQSGISGIRPIPDAVLTITNDIEGASTLNVVIKLSDVWMFCLIVLHLILLTAVIILIFVGNNLMLDLFKIVAGIGLIQLMIYIIHTAETERYRNFLEKLIVEIESRDLTL